MTWIETSNGNRISNDANISGSANILLSGNTTVCPHAVLNAELPDLPDTAADAHQGHVIQVGKFCFLSSGCSISPPGLNLKSTGRSNDVSSIRIGSYSIIGENSVVLLASIGNRVLVEKNCTLGSFSIVYDCCVIKEGTVIPPNAVIPPFSEVSGTPGVDFVVSPLHNSYRKLIELEAKEKYLLG